MPRGGRRENAGRKSTWPSGCSFNETTLIRIPAYLKDQFLEVAKRMDAGDSIEFVSKSKIVALVEPIDSVTVSEGQMNLLESSVDSAESSMQSTEDDGLPLSKKADEIVTESIYAPLTATALAKRMNHSRRPFERATKKAKDGSIISRSDCIEWTKKHDPEGIGWWYDPSDKKYHPVTGDEF